MEPLDDEVSNNFSKVVNTLVATTGELPRNASYTSYGDPWLDANLSGGGVAPGRIYNTGLMHNGYGTGISAVGVWRSNDNGTSWSAPVVAASSGSNSVFLDRPTVTVSTASGSQGYVYLAYTRFSTSGGDHYIYVRKSTDGGQSFGNAVQVAAGPQLTPTSIVVTPTNGTVSVIWADFGSTPNRIQASQSTDQGATWSAAETAATSTYGFLAGQDFINADLRAFTGPVAKFNAAANRLSIVWHEREAAGANHCDVYFVSKGTNWQSKVLVNDRTAGDQFFPAVDFDAGGNGFVTFYDSDTGPEYQMTGVKVNSLGARLASSVIFTSCGTDPSGFGPAAECCEPPKSCTCNFIGDYHQTRFDPLPTGAGWISGFVYNPQRGPSEYGGIWFGANNP